MASEWGLLVHDKRMRTPEQGRAYFAVQCICARHHLKISLILILFFSVGCAVISEAQTCGRIAGCSDGSVSGTQAVSSHSLIPRMHPATANAAIPTDASNGSRESVETVAVAKKSRLPAPDFNREIFYRNKLEFSVD